MIENKRTSYMFVARTPCGKVSAMAWEQPDFSRNSESIREWLLRGDVVERIAFVDGDDLPADHDK